MAGDPGVRDPLGVLGLVLARSLMVGPVVASIQTTGGTLIRITIVLFYLIKEALVSLPLLQKLMKIQHGILFQILKKSETI